MIDNISQYENKIRRTKGARIELRYINYLLSTGKNEETKLYFESLDKNTYDIPIINFRTIANALRTLYNLELNYKEEISQLYEGELINNSIYASEKINSLKETSKKTTNKISKHYLLILNSLTLILKNFKTIMSAIEEDSAIDTNALEFHLVDSFTKTKYRENKKYNDEIINELSMLERNIKNANLFCSENPSKSNPELRKQRSKKAADASHFGESILLDLIIKKLEELRDETKSKNYKNIKDFYNRKPEIFIYLLKYYQSNLLGTVDISSGRKIAYGKNIKPDNILRKLKEWLKDYPSFYKELANHHLK